MTVRAIESTVRGFANAVRRAAVRDKNVAQELVFKHGIRGEITPNALKGITKDMFDATGKLTEKGKKELQSVMERTGLPANATWDQVFEAVIKSKNELAKKIESAIISTEETVKNFQKTINKEDVKNAITKKYNRVTDELAKKVKVPDWMMELKKFDKDVKFDFSGLFKSPNA